MVSGFSCKLQAKETSLEGTCKTVSASLTVPVFIPNITIMWIVRQYSLAETLIPRLCCNARYLKCFEYALQMTHRPCKPKISDQTVVHLLQITDVLFP